MPAHVKRQRTVENTLPSQMLALEPRYLFDAAVVTTVAEVTSETVTPPPATTAVEPADLLVDGQVFSVFENTPAGTELSEVTGGVPGDGVIDTTPETGTLTWSKTGGGTGASAFTIMADGKIQVLDPSLLNHEVTPGYTLEVRAVDEFGGEDTTLIDITVLDANDPPTVTGDVPNQNVLAGNTLSVDVESETGAIDEDGDPLSYELFEPPAGASIDQDGIFIWNTSPGQDGTTTITVLISNDFNPGLANTVTFDVTVDPVLINISDATTVEEGNALQYTVSLDGAAPAATADVASDSLYGVSLNGYYNGIPGSSSLYVIDEVTGAGTLIGDIGYAVNSIAFDPTTGLMYGSTTSWSGTFNGLLQIDPSTGAARVIGAFGDSFWSILGLSFNSSGELFGWHDPDADDPVIIDKATGAATTIGEAGISTGGQVLAFDNSDALTLVQSSSQYDINLITGAAAFTKGLGFDPGSGGADIHNTTGDLWAPASNGRTQDSFIRVTDLAANTYTDIDTDVEYLNALAFGGTGDFLPTFPTVTADLTMVTFSGTATAGTDYEQVFYSDAALTNPITSVTLGGVNPDSMDIYVKTYDNDPPFNEADEKVIITLPSDAITNAIPGDTSPPGAAIISAIPSGISAEGTITDSTLPTIGISDATPVEEGNALHYTVSLNGDTEVAVTTGLGFGAGTTATAGTDYEQAFYSDAALTNPVTSVTLGDGNPTSVEVYVKTFNNDPLYNEANENVEVVLTGVTNATGGDTAAGGTITDSTLPTIDISDATPVEEGNALHYTVSLNGDTGVAVTAGLGFGAGTTATGGTTDNGTNDYQTTFYSNALLTTPITSVTLGGGNPTSIDVFVKTFDNDPPYSEGNETVEVALTSIANAINGNTTADGTVTDGTPQPPPPPTVNDATVILSEESSVEPGDEGGDESGDEEGDDGGDEVGEEGGEPGAPGDGGPVEGDGVTQEDVAEIEAEVEALIDKGDFSETTEGPAAGKPDSQQPQTRAEEVAQIMSIMSKAISLVSCNRDLPNGPL